MTPKGPTSPADHASETEVLEWDRIRSFLRAASTPLAIIEVGSHAQAAEVLDELCRLVSLQHLHLFRAGKGEDFRRPLDWLEEQTDDQGVFVFTGLDAYTDDEESKYLFWTWANAQRERWPRDYGNIIFLLLPDQVDDLCRYAPMLWDWIPLKFNLLRTDKASHRVPEDDMPTAVRAANDETPVPDARPRHLFPSDKLDDDYVEKRLAALRQQLLRARQKGLPEHLICKDYAYPLFRALVKAGKMDEAGAILESDLGYAFPTELPFHHARDARKALEELIASSGFRDPSGRAHAADLATRFYLSSRSPEFLTYLGPKLILIALFMLTQICEDDDAGAFWSDRLLGLGEKAESESDIARACTILGLCEWRRGVLDAAEEWNRKALATYERLGEVDRVATLVRRLALIEWGRKVPDSRLGKASANPLAARLRQTAEKSRTKRIGVEMLKKVAGTVEGITRNFLILKEK